MTNDEPRLTSLAHGGGCGCKMAPAALQAILKGSPSMAGYADLLVGRETSDDAAVWRLNDHQALVATTDFFMPVVDDPFDFGRIAAANALSDIYAMGGRPIFALAIVGMPIKVLSTSTIGRILSGGASVCAAAGVPVAGGHSIDSLEPLYGLAALGLIHPEQVLTNRGARNGDLLILTKPIGVGVLSAAFKAGRLEPDGYAALIASTTQLNTLGEKLAGLVGVHAMTDVTGFGLLGHALEMARASEVTVELNAEPPLLKAVHELMVGGVRTGASIRNWESYGDQVDLPQGFDPLSVDLLTDPQTSGGLLISVAADQVEPVLELARDDGFLDAAVVGRVVTGPPRARVTA
jgi:selenide,water dikinase